MGSKRKLIRVARLRRQSGSRSNRHGPPRGKTDPDRENRIAMEVVVDAYDGPERAMGWFSYLENQLKFPFSAHCTERRAISPLLVGDEVEVIRWRPRTNANSRCS